MSETAEDLTRFPDASTSAEPDASSVAEGTGRIRPRARLLRTIGAELISSEVVAVIELVRNSYDADASEVKLLFESPEDPDSASLEIRDNGHGMTREVLLGPWLEPATDYKSGEDRDGFGGERSPRGRRRLGSKGVGRFAAQRIGSQLELRTRAEGGSTELVAWFDWTALEEGKYLDQLRVPWKERRPESIHEIGTRLCISGLRDRWTPDRFEKLRVALSRLISPTIEEDFSIEISINGSSETVEAAVGLDEAMYRIQGAVGEDGSCVIEYSDLNGAHERWERTVLWPGSEDQRCGPFEFLIGAWDLDSEPLRHFLDLTGKTMGLRGFRRAVRDHSGITLYRDGFRILPYGEPDNDWLRLDRRRVNNPTMRLSNNQIIGRILLSADENPELKDQTNREGLVNNDAYGHLQEVVLELLGYLETRRFASRRAMDIDWQRRSTSLPSLDDEGTDRIASILKSLGNSKGSFSDGTEEVLDAFHKLRKTSAETVRHYAGMATSGQLAGLVFQQLRHPIRQIQSELDLALEDLSGEQLSEEERSDLQESLKAAVQHLRTMEKRMDKLDPLAIGGRGRRVSKVHLASALGDVLEAFQDELDRKGVFIDFEPDPEHTVQTNREIAQQVFSNLLDNALYWADQGEAENAIVTVGLTPSGFSIRDTGPGVPDDLRHGIFEPHFTTRDGATGLGLTLVKDLLTTIGGRIRLTDPSCARFSVELQRG